MKQKELKEIIAEASMQNSVVKLVTHNGVCHTDDISSTVILQMLFESLSIKTEVLRTRNEQDIPSEGPVIVYDVFGGRLDHHQDDSISRGRQLSAIGKIWSWGKDVFIQAFKIDEDAWNDIDKHLFKHIDITDNTGEMNPLNYSVNSIRGCQPTEEAAFEMTCMFIRTILDSVIKQAQDCVVLKKEFRKLPTKKIEGLNLKVNDDPSHFIRPFFSPEFDGYIWKKENDTWAIRLNSKVYELKPAIKAGEIPGVIFTHKNGFMGEICSLDDIKKVIIKKERA